MATFRGFLAIDIPATKEIITLENTLKQSNAHLKLVEPESTGAIPHKIRGPISMISALLSTMMEAHDARYIKDAQFVRTIPIPTLGVGTTEFDITRERSEQLFQSGWNAAETFFQTWDFKKYIQRYRSVQAEPGRGVRLRKA